MTAVFPDSSLRLLAALFSPLAHDLRAGLNGISVWTHILERNADEANNRAVQGIRRALAQHSDLAQDLSDFGRALGGVADGNGGPAQELGQVVRDACKALAAVAEQRHVSVGVQGAAALAVAVAQPALVKEALLLVLRDALLAVPESGRADIVGAVASDAVSLAFTLSTAENPAELLAWSGPTRRSVRQAIAALGAAVAGGGLDISQPDRVVFHLPVQTPA